MTQKQFGKYLRFWKICREIEATRADLCVSVPPDSDIWKFYLWIINWINIKHLTGQKDHSNTFFSFLVWSLSNKYQSILNHYPTLYKKTLSGRLRNSVQWIKSSLGTSSHFAPLVYSVRLFLHVSVKFP